MGPLLPAALIAVAALALSFEAKSADSGHREV